ncbi:MAG: hypothetical protein ACE5D7_01965, partial [Fidelibacterota bacterium]
MSITNKIYQRFWIQVLGLLVIDMIILPFLPWWTLIVPAFIFGRIYSSPCNAFLAPGLGGLLSWAVMILFR